MTNTPSPDEDREMIERLKKYRGGDCEYRKMMDEAADRLESLLSDRAEQDATINLQAQRLMELSSEIVQLREAANTSRTDHTT